MSRDLVNVSDDDKAVRIGEDETEGGLTAKVCALRILNKRSFTRLDGVVGTELKISSTVKHD